MLAQPPQERRARQHWAVQLWRLITAECWLRAQEDADFAARLGQSVALAPGDVELLATVPV
jgi:hypothetical protein